MIFDVRKLEKRPRRELEDSLREYYAAHYARVFTDHFGYLRTEKNGSFFDALAHFTADWYGAQHDQCDYPERGLFIFGPPGTGKTMAMQILSGVGDVEFLPCRELSKSFSLSGAAGFWRLTENFSRSHLILDDLGCEDQTRNFGNALPMVDFLRERESLWREHGIYTFFTSNAQSRGDVLARYGASVCSRLLGMCDFWHLPGSDFRQRD